jgi:membrane protease YdiL (CAAX protease family)
MLSQWMAVLFVFLLVAGVPALSFMTARRSQVRQMPRLAIYFSAVLSQWLLAVLGIGVVFVTWRSFRAASFRALSPTVVMSWAFFLAAVSLAGVGISLLLERWGWWPAESELVCLLIPETRQEKLWSVLLLAPTAAFCEEFLYRGYLLAQLSQWVHSVSWAWIVSSIAFGLAHAYQGWSGVLRAALLGAVLAYPVVHLGSLYPSMVAHALIDAVALAWLGPAFLRRKLIP